MVLTRSVSSFLFGTSQFKYIFLIVKQYYYPSKIFTLTYFLTNNTVLTQPLYTYVNFIEFITKINVYDNIKNSQYYYYLV